MKGLLINLTLFVLAGMTILNDLHAQSDSKVTYTGIWRWVGKGQAFEKSQAPPSGTLILQEHDSGLISGHSIITFTIPGTSPTEKPKGGLYQFVLEGKKEVSTSGDSRIKFKVFGKDGLTVTESSGSLSPDGKFLLGVSKSTSLDAHGNKTYLNYNWTAKRVEKDQ